jgi:N-acetyl-gamma-glutamyl-phosphate reductase
MIKASIIGATGYTGVELVRLLHRHEQVEIISLTSRSFEDEDYSGIYPNLSGYIHKQCVEADIPKIVAESDIIFVALPHGHSVEVVKEAFSQGKKVIDLGADFRFDEGQTYEDWYKVVHESKDLLAKSAYGLPEVNRTTIKQVSIIGNPGCYPTSVILGLAPALANKVVDTNSIIIDAKSGVSGAGRTLALGSHFVEANDNVNAYGVGKHRHTPEIEQELGKIAGESFTVSFTPHLMPMTRGILSTIYASLKGDWSTEQVRELYQKFYQDEPFVHLLPEGQWPHTKWVYGSNDCHLNLLVDPRTNRLIITSAIDNLVKGAAGQAVQNMNILFDLPETTALLVPGLFP